VILHWPTERVYVAGHTGLVGSALVRRLRSDGVEPVVRTREELDLRDPAAVAAFFAEERPTIVLMAAGRVGGIQANSRYPAEFIADNLAMQLNVVRASHEYGVDRLLLIGSSCTYPRDAQQPMREEYLLTGPLEATNQPFAIAKLAGLELCKSYQRQYGCRFITAIPCNLYGPGDSYDLETSHVLPALVRKFHEAKRDASPAVVVWGTGAARREFLHVDDLAEASLLLLERWEGPDPVNVGAGADLTISQLAEMVADVVGFGGRIVYDPSKPDGHPRKLLDTTRISALGWTPRVDLCEGIRATYASYRGTT
jgi:GDP-L-fucose synthase